MLRIRGEMEAGSAQARKNVPAKRGLACHCYNSNFSTVVF
jgi:hypothetical protein